MDYPFSVFIGFTKAVSHAQKANYKTMLNVIRVAVSDNDQRCKAVWKELSRGG